MADKSIGNRHDLIVKVADNLTSTEGQSALAANQGRVLDESKANKDTDATPGNVAIFDDQGNPIDGGVGLSDKADKDTDAVSGHVAIFNNEGNVVDGGTTIADLNDGWEGQVNTFADLPAASDNNGKKYAVISPTGTIVLGTKKYAGTYISDGTNWNIFGYKQASVINQLLIGFTTASSTAAIVATDSILAAFGKVQKYLTDYLTNFNGANQLVKLNASGELPAVDASNLTGIPAGNQLSETLHCNDNVVELRGTDSSPDSNHYIKFNSSLDGVEIKSHGTTLMSSFTLFNGSKSLNKSFAYFNSSANTGTVTNYTADYSAEFEKRILADEFNANSDERIKKIEGISDGKKDLKILQKLEITDYCYVDTILKGAEPRKKLIAQQVEQHFPQAVSKVEGYVPSIYSLCEVKSDKIFCETKNLKINTKLKIITEKESELIVTIIKVQDDFIVIDRSIASEKVFVYGEWVDNFRVIDYEAVSMLAVSALQELAKRIDNVETNLKGWINE